MKKALMWIAILLYAATTLAQSPNGGYSSPSVGAGGLSFVASLPATCTPGVTASVQLSVSPFLIYSCTATNTWRPDLTSTNALTGGKCLQSNGTGGLVVEITGGCAVTLPAVASTASVTSSNPTINTDQQLIELSLSAGYLNTLSQPWIIHGSGIYSTTTASSPALTIKAKICTVSGCGSGTVVTAFNIVTTALNTTAVTNATWNLEGRCVTNATGATGNLVCHSAPGFTLDTGASLGIADSVFADTNTATLANIDLTAALFLDFTIAQSVVGASNSYTQQMAIIAPPSGAGGSGISATAGQTLYASATNQITGGAGVLDMAGVAGADLGAKMNTCAATANVKTCLGDNLTGAQTLSTAVAVPANITFHFCGQSISQTAAVTLPNANGAIVGCSSAATTFTKAASLDQFNLSGVNTYLGFLTLVGVGGSFTGQGIVNAVSSGTVEHNIISGEAGTGINDSSGGKVQFNVASSSSAGNPITSGNSGFVFGNTLTCTLSDCFKVSGGNNIVFSHNTIILNPNASTSGLCGENFSGDQIGNSSLFNQITISDSTNTGNTDKGICLTAPASGHLLNMLVDGGVITGVVSGTVTTYSVSVNNALGLGNNWSVVIRDIRAVHIGPPVSTGAIIQDIDALNNPVTWENLQLGDGTGFTDGTTTGNNNIYELVNNPLSFANFPAGPGNGSIITCSNCGAGISAPVGGSGSPNVLTRAGGVWVGQPVGTWTFVQAGTGNTNTSATTTGAITTIPGDLLVVTVSCSTAAGAPTFTLTDAKGVFFTSAITQVTNTTASAQIFWGIATGGSETVTDTSTVNVCNANHGVVISEYQHLAQISPEDGPGSSATGNSTALASGSYACTTGDLVIGVGHALATGIAQGAGFQSRGTPSSASMTEDQTCAAGTANVTFSAASGNWVAAGVAFKRMP